MSECLKIVTIDVEEKLQTSIDFISLLCAKKLNNHEVEVKYRNQRDFSPSSIKPVAEEGRKKNPANREYFIK